MERTVSQLKSISIQAWVRPWTVFKWRLRPVLHWKNLSHTMQPNGFAPECFRIWSCISHLFLATYTLHRWHSYWRPLHWISCRSFSNFRTNWRMQRVQSNRSWPFLCDFICKLRWLILLNCRTHRLQWYKLLSSRATPINAPLVWVFWCLFRSLFLFVA